METIKKVTPEEYVCKIWGLEVGHDHSEFLISADMAISHIKSYIEREHIGLHKDHITITDQANVLQKTLDKLLTTFDSDENRIDFILDICNEYKKQLSYFITESRFTE